MILPRHFGGTRDSSCEQFSERFSRRHHTTVLHAVSKIEILRKTDETFDALLDVLTASLTSEGKGREPEQAVLLSAHSELIDAVAARVIERMQDIRTIGKARNESLARSELVVSGVFNDIR